MENFDGMNNGLMGNGEMVGEEMDEMMSPSPILPPQGGGTFGSEISPQGGGTFGSEMSPQGGGSGSATGNDEMVGEEMDEMLSPSPILPPQGGGTFGSEISSQGGGSGSATGNDEISSQGGGSGSAVGDDAAGSFQYLSNEQNLAVPVFKAETVDQDAPFSSFAMAGKWLREAADLSNYWEGIKRLGEDVASYKWAYDEGKLGEFDGKKFGKEALKAGVRSIGQDTLRTTGNLLSMFGANLENGSMPVTIMTSGAGAVLPQAGKLFKDLGTAFRSYADDIENISFMATPAEAFEDSPSWSKLANAVGAGASQVLAMGGLAKLIGARATYGFFAGGGAGEIFNETLEQGGDVDKANTLAAANAGVTFAIDKLFDPLPETIAKNAKLTSKKVAAEMLGAPLREVGSEVLQQMLAENLVRKAGLDDTQDLFEGLLESALGAFAGSAMVSVPSGGAYFAQDSLNKARRKIRLKGVTDEELDLYEKNMMALIEQKPEAFEKILGANLKENLRQMDLAARSAKNRRERAEKRGDVQGFDEVYTEMYDRFLPVLGDENKAKAAARLFEANAVSLYQFNPEMTPRKLIDGYLPQLKRADAASFLAKKLPEQSVSFSLIGINAKQADTNMLTQAMTMFDNKVDPLVIWQNTGWHFGGDGKWRMEISDRDATVKRWEDLNINEMAIDMLHDHKIEMEKIKAYLAAALRGTAMNNFGSFYVDFYKYLEDKHIAEMEGVEPERKLGVFEVISEADRQRREIEDALLTDLFRKYRTMHPDSSDFKSVDELVDFMEKGEGRTTFDFTEEQYQYIMGLFEARRRHEFFQAYWNERTGVRDNDDFTALAHTMSERYKDDPRFLEGLAEVFYRTTRRKQARMAEVKRLMLEKYPYFFEDIEKDQAYGYYRLFSGAFTPDMSRKNIYPESYKRAYLPKTASEDFLAQRKFNYMTDEDKRILAGYLDVEEKIFKVDKYLQKIKNDEFLKSLPPEYTGFKSKDSVETPNNGEIDLDTVLELMERKKKEPKHLGDILEHPQLFANYPTLADMNISFAILKNHAPYHAYYDVNKGYVLEINPAEVGKDQLKEVLLKGAAFVIQDIEEFDYSLTEEERRNFMNRQIFMARKKLESLTLTDLEEYVDHYLPRVNMEEFIVENTYPLPLAGLAQSADVDAPAPDKVQKISFKTVDYDKLYLRVRKKYGAGMQKGGIRLRHLAFGDLQQIKRMNAAMVMAEARANGGYSAGLMPWAGITSQGAVDERALVSRMNLSEQQLKDKPFFELAGDLRAVKEETNCGVVSDKKYMPEMIDPYEEFAEIIKEDSRNYRRTLDVLAKGAFDSADRTITLFETADADTLVHETFHYFWDLMEKTEHRNESHASVFWDVMSELKDEFVHYYVVKEFDGKWFVLHKDKDEMMEELPRSFESKTDAIEAGVREYFVVRFLRLLNNTNYLKGGGIITDAADFYRRWLKTLTDKLEIKNRPLSRDGWRLLQFLKKKIK